MKSTLSKKSVLCIVIVLIAVMFCLTGCCQHTNVSAADCTRPSVCRKCGEVVGDALGHQYAAATCTSPLTCVRCGETKGVELGHQYADATCTSPMTCTLCGETEGTALGHDFTEATCQSPKTCTRCGETEGTKGEHRFTDATTEYPATCEECGYMLPSDLPETGTYFTGEDTTNDGTVEIDCSESDMSYYFKMKDSDENELCSFFVRAGDQATFYIPAETLYLYYCCGEDWYGTAECFGEDTSYAMDEEATDYYEYSVVYTFYPVEDGNFTGTPIAGSTF